MWISEEWFFKTKGELSAWRGNHRGCRGGGLYSLVSIDQFLLPRHLMGFIIG